MRTRQSSKRGLILLITLFLLINLPQQQVLELRGMAVAGLTPIQKITSLPQFLLNIFSKQEPSRPEREVSLNLESENQQLKNEIARWKELFQHELHILSQLSMLSQQLKNLEPETQRHCKIAEELAYLKLAATPARVVFRSPLSWNNSIWIDVGSTSPSIEKNSPVLSGHSVIGVIDYVGLHQSRVRLISDPGLSLSVRSARGDPQNKLLIEQLQLFIGLLAVRNELFPTKIEKQESLTALNKLKERLESTTSANELLAKGELRGSSGSSWRQANNYLEGIGFNYEFPDSEGPARDLRTGQPLDGSGRAGTPLLKVHDLLVTTGLDGVFPPGLPVAEVIKIHLLKEGDYSYSLEAKPTAGDLQQLSLVHVLPARGYDANDQPKLYRQQVNLNKTSTDH